MFWKAVGYVLTVLTLLAFALWRDTKDDYATPSGEICSRFLFQTDCRQPDDAAELVFIRSRDRGVQCDMNARLLANWPAEVSRHTQEVEGARTSLQLVSRDDYRVQRSAEQRREGLTADAARANLIADWRATLEQREFCLSYAMRRAAGRTGDEAIRGLAQRIQSP